MPSRSEMSYEKTPTVRKISQNGRANIGMRIKFYETQDNDGLLNGGNHIPTQKSSYLKTSEQQQRQDFVMENEPRTYRRTSGKEQQKSSSRDKKTRERHIYEDSHHLEPTGSLKLNGNTQNKEPVQMEKHRRSRRKAKTATQPTKEETKPNGLYFAVTGQTSTDITAELQPINGHVQSSPGASPKNKDISFLSVAQIGEIYQNPSRRSSSKKNGKPAKVHDEDRSEVETGTQSLEIEDGSRDYKWKIIESKNVLQQLRKSLSNDDDLGFFEQEEAMEASIRKERRRRKNKSSSSTQTKRRSSKDILEKISKEEFVQQPASKDDIIAVASNYFTGKTQGVTTIHKLPSADQDVRKPDSDNGKDNEEHHLAQNNEKHGDLSTRKSKSRTNKSQNHVSERSRDTKKRLDQNDIQNDKKAYRIQKDFEEQSKTAPKEDIDATPESKQSDRRTQDRQISSRHIIATKQDSNDSDASTISKRLLTLSEIGKSPKQSPQRMKRMSAKRFSWKKTEIMNSPNDSSPPEEERKRRTVSAIEYTLADISPGPVRSKKRLTLPRPRPEKISFKRDETDQPLTPESYKSDLSQDRSPSPLERTQTSSSQSSLMAGDAQLVFRMDLDKPYHGRGIGETSPMSPPNESDNWTRPKGSNKMPNKWIQTDGPPIRAPKSRTSETQTGINPCVSASKKLQTRPWNLPEHLSNNGAQTNSKRTAEIGTQTLEERHKTQSCQTPKPKYQNLMTQTPLRPLLREIGIQFSPEMVSTEVQTPDEDSDIWGNGNGISLDRLIRNGAIKRSQSMGHGVIESPEKLRERSSSIDAISAQQNTAQKRIPLDGTETSGKITTYSWNENGKFVKIFVSYSGIHLIPSKNIQVKTNGINLLLIVEEPDSENSDSVSDTTTTSSEKQSAITSTLYLNRLRRPVACLSYNVQRDMITIMLRKQKQTPWNSLVFGGKIV